jgi:hypothetical protein
MDLKQGVKVWTAFIWLIMATCGGILWTQQWISGFHERRRTY